MSDGGQAALSGAPKLAGALWRFRPFGRPHAKALAAGVALRVGEVVADLTQPWPLAIVVDGVLARHRLTGVLGDVSRLFAGSRTACSPTRWWPRSSSPRSAVCSTTWATRS